MKKLYISFITFIVFALFYTCPHAAVCSIDAPNGQRYYRMQGKPTITISARVAAIKPCNAEGLRVEPSVEDARCLQSAMAVCDPTWGGIKLLLNPTVPESDNQNLYFRALSGTDDNGLTYYRRLQVYDATKAAP